MIADAGITLLFLGVLAALYFIPTIVAGHRHVTNVGSIAVINVFLGWTFIGWVVALAMACRSAPPRPPAPWEKQKRPGMWPPPPSD